jgi:hypothetical protein
VRTYIQRLSTPSQLDVYRDDLLRTAQTILDETALAAKKTAEQVYRELVEHLDGSSSKGVWLVLRDGVLLAWIAAKVYTDEGRLTAAVTWAWAAPGAEGWSAKALDGVVRWARRERATSIYCTRRTRLKAFARLMRRYGWRFEAAVFGQSLDGDTAARPVIERRFDDIVVEGAQHGRPEDPRIDVPDADDDAGAARPPARGV